MAFWRIGNGFSSLSAIDKILDKDNHELEELLDEPDLLQELMAPNTKLIEYLRQDDVMRKLVSLVVARESDDVPKNKDDDESAAGDKDTSKDGDGDDGRRRSGDAMDTDSDDASGPQKRSSGDMDDDDDEHNDRDNARSRERSNGDDDDDDEEDEDEDEKEKRQQYAQVAAEILSADVWSLTESLMESRELLDRLWAVLDYDAPLDVSHSTHFTKICEHLLDKKTDEMLAFIRSQKNFVKRFVRHIDNPPLMDFLLKVISSDKAENSTGVIEFLQRQRLIPALVGFLAPDVPSAVQSAAGDFLKAFITISANSNADNTTIGPNELSRELVSEPVMKEMLRLMLHGGTGLSTGVGVIIELIRKNNSDYDYAPVMYITMESHPPGPRDPIYLGTMVKLFAAAIPQLQEILAREHPEQLETPFGRIEPLGFERFKVCELIAELLHCSNMALLNDANGESVVRARDEERERVKRVIARARGDASDDEADQSDQFDDANSSFEDEKKKSESIENDIEKLNMEEKNQAEKTDAEKEDKEKDADKSDSYADKDADKDDSDESMKEAGDATAESTAADKTEDGGDGDDTIDGQMSLEQQEAAIRAKPVVGDQLKLALADNNCITTILNMFFKFPWNNFLHNVVFDIVQQILNGPMHDGYNKFLAIDLFGKGRLTDLICEGHTHCEEYEAEHKMRLGYMGHLTLISEEVVKFTAVYTPESISPVIADAVAKQQWIQYVTHTLVKTRDQYNLILGGRRPDGSDVVTNPDAIILGNGTEMGDDDEDEDHDDHDDDSELGSGGRVRLRGGDDDDDHDDDDRDQARDHDADRDGDDDDDDHDGATTARKPSEDHFVRYLSEQMSGSGHVGLGSSDEDDDDDEWEDGRRYRSKRADTTEDADQSPQRGYLQDDDSDDDDLGLVRSPSYHDMN